MAIDDSRLLSLKSQVSTPLFKFPISPDFSQRICGPKVSSPKLGFK